MEKKKSNAGKPSHYTEPTFAVGFKVPKSKIPEFKDYAIKKLKTWKKKKYQN